jgi:hypothetical protein
LDEEDGVAVILNSFEGLVTAPVDDEDPFPRKPPEEKWGQLPTCGIAKVGAFRFRVETVYPPWRGEITDGDRAG